MPAIFVLDSPVPVTAQHLFELLNALETRRTQLVGFSAAEYSPLTEGFYTGDLREARRMLHGTGGSAAAWASDLTARLPVHRFQNGDFRFCGTLQERPACEIEEDPGGASRRGGEKMLQLNTIAQFPARLRGEVISPNDQSYASARSAAEIG